VREGGCPPDKLLKLPLRGREEIFFAWDREFQYLWLEKSRVKDNGQYGSTFCEYRPGDAAFVAPGYEAMGSRKPPQSCQSQHGMDPGVHIIQPAPPASPDSRENHVFHPIGKRIRGSLPPQICNTSPSASPLCLKIIPRSGIIRRMSGSRARLLSGITKKNLGGSFTSPTSCYARSIFSPSLRVTMAFFQCGRRPKLAVRSRFFLPV
jgi:hypothetical protein